MNYKDENKKIIENANYRYYQYTEEIIKTIIKKDIHIIENSEWRTLIQMLYPKNMIGSGLFQPILIFEIKNGKRKDPPIEAYNGVDDLENGSCLLIKIIDYIEKNSNLKFNKSWYIVKNKILENKE